MLDHKGNGMSATGISHESALFQPIIDETEAVLRTLMNIPNDYEVLFLQGGTSLQLVMIPMNSMHNREADYIVTGYWTKKAYQGTRLYGEIHVATSSEDDNFSHIPDYNDPDISPDSDCVYMCENSTIYGAKFHKRPDSKEKILIGDISSCFLSEPINVPDYDMLFSGIQKNLGLAGLVIAIVREGLISETVLPGTPTMLQYETHTDKGSMYNTPPTYNIYIVGGVIEWTRSLDNLDKMKKINESEATLLYDYSDRSDMFCGLADRNSRSLVNITFHIGSEVFGSAFIETAGENGIINIKGYRAIDGTRANLYNAMPTEGVQHLVQSTETFEKSEGQCE